LRRNYRQFGGSFANRKGMPNPGLICHAARLDIFGRTHPAASMLAFAYPIKPYAAVKVVE
jgi:hypothetical protein